MEKSQVTLHGTWASTYSKRVEIALKLKGIPYEYVEEDLKSKSQTLLQLNPVHKKVPVLVHNGKAIAESLVILEYIDEKWNNSPKLLPDDPYERAQVRFWANYIQQQLFEVIAQVVFSEGEAQAKAVEETKKRLKVLDEGLKTHYSSSKGSIKIDQNNLDLLDIILCTAFGAHEAYRQVFGVEILEPENTPFILNRVENIRELPVIKEVAPPYDKVVPLLIRLRQNRFQYNRKYNIYKIS